MLISFSSFHRLLTSFNVKLRKDLFGKALHKNQKLVEKAGSISAFSFVSLKYLIGGHQIKASNIDVKVFDHIVPGRPCLRELLMAVSSPTLTVD